MFAIAGVAPRHAGPVLLLDALCAQFIVDAEDVHSTPTAALAVVPLLGLLAMFARERQDRLQSLLELHSAYRGAALVLGDVVEADAIRASTPSRSWGWQSRSASNLG